MRQIIKFMPLILLLGLFHMPTSVSAQDDDDDEVSDSQSDEEESDISDLTQRANYLLFQKPNPTSQDTADFVAICRQIADSSAWAAYNLGVAYAGGWSMPKDVRQAVIWYIKSAEMGDVDGMLLAGSAKLAGDVTEQDIPAGLDWLTKSAKQGNTAAARKLGELYTDDNNYTTKDNDLAYEFFKMAADSGDNVSLHYLADIYADHTNWHYNDTAAFLLANHFASQGEVEYEDRMGDFYLNGVGVEKDMVTAGNYFYQAAIQNYALSEWSLAEMCYWGDGTSINYVQSYFWVKRAVDHGVNEAKPLRDSLDLVMTPAQKDSAVTATPEWKPLIKADSLTEDSLKK